MNYYTQTSLRLGWSVIIGVITPLMMPNLVEGASLRTRMTNEGYLSFQHDRPFIDQNGKEIRGEERTGWTDIRHPALDGTLDRKRGYDWSDNQVMVLTHNVQVDPPKGPPGDSTVNGDLRRQDFNVANAIYAQAGISILQEGNMDTQGNDIVPVMGNNGPSLSMLFANDRSKNANTVNQYYVDNIPGARGQTIPPQFGAGIAPPSGP